MSTDSDNGLGDSAYEMISGTENEESQDGQLSESTSSLDIPRPDDVHSLDGSEDYASDDDSENDSDDSSHASSIRYAAESLESPSKNTPIGTLELSRGPAGVETAADAIEFREGDGSVAAGNISVKHAIREFTEEETAVIASNLKMGAPPKRLVATVRQTMSQAYLSTEEPLRILYVGHADAKRDIILKISNAIWASSNATPSGGSGGGVYNIVPISSFGPTPELDLMEASQCQIKVQHCTNALALEMGAFGYSITIDNDPQQSYITSSYPTGGFSVHPPWSLPHIAIFYCSDEDSEEDQNIREAAWKFMKRHGVSSIFISESEAFVKDTVGPLTEYINEDAVHVCLESRDPELPAPLRQFPIDLASFLHIDARQMNRNLAHLAGLPQPPAKTELPTPQKGKRSLSSNLRGAWDSTSAYEKLLYITEHYKWLVTLLIPITAALMAPFLSAMVGWPYSGNSTPLVRSSATDVLGLPSTACLSQPMAPSSSTSALLSTTTSTSTSTVVVNVTSTKTIKISQVLPTTSSLASALSFAGLLDKPSDPPVEIKKSTCSVRVFSPTEVLVVVPTSRMASFFTKEPVIDVTRDGHPVDKTISLVDEGIMVLIPQNDAHGTLNVSVVSLRKPKINETFEVDFGKPPPTDVFQAGIGMLQDFANMIHLAVDDVSFPDLAKIRGEVTAAWEQTKEAGKQEMERDVEELKQGLSHLATSAERIRDEANLKILHAQVTSKLWWLKVTGRNEELAEYKRNATVFIKAKCAEMLQKQLKEKPGPLCKSGSRACSSRQADAKPDGGRRRRWTKLISG